MTHWEAQARGLLFTHGKDVGNRVTLDFENGAKIIAKALGEAYLQGRKDEDAAWLDTPLTLAESKAVDLDIDDGC